MLFGSKDDFAVECHLHSVPAMRRNLVMGRMCVWCGGEVLGDPDDVNVLGVPEQFFGGLIDRLGGLRDEAVDSLPDDAAFRLLDAALYGDDDGDDHSLAEVRSDALRFSKFGFLTNWGESFDGTKAFLLHAGDRLRVLFRRGGGPVQSRRVTEQGLREAVRGFLQWVGDQRLPGDVTEADWLESDDVEGMADWLRGRGAATERKLRLFDCACCRRIWPLLPDARSRAAVEVAERFADGAASAGDLRAARDAAKDAAHVAGHGGLSADGYAAWAAVYAAYEAPSASAPYNTRMTVYYAAGGDAAPARLENDAQVRLLREVFGNPFREATVGRAGPARTIVTLARTIYEERAFERMQELADALKEAGCTDDEMLTHCRGGGDHVRGCWVVDLLLGKR